MAACNLKDSEIGSTVRIRKAKDVLTANHWKKARRCKQGMNFYIEKLRTISDTGQRVAQRNVRYS